MIVTSVDEKRATDLHVRGEGWSSTRLLVRGDGLDYSLNDTYVDEGVEMRLHYKNHVETNYCVSGAGEVVDLATGQVHAIGPGSVYTLDKHDEHIVRAGKGGLHFVCVFTPPLEGHETHGSDGSYPAADAMEEGRQAPSAAPGSSTLSRVDHAVIYAGAGLDSAVEQFTRLGFHLTPRGHHSMGSSNHLAIFESDYFELLGVEPQNVARFGDGWNHPLGLSGLVFKTADARALWRELSARGVPLEGDAPAAFNRPVDLPDGHRETARFRTVRLAADSVPNGRVFFCEQITPELVWRPEWQRHPNGATGILEYAVATRDPSSLASVLDSAVGPDLVKPVDGGLQLQLGPTRVVLLTPEAIAVRYGVPARDVSGGIPRPVALTVRVSSLDAVRGVVQRARIIGVREVDGRLVVPAAGAAGVVLGFAQA